MDRHSPGLSVSSSTDHQLLVAQRGCFTSSSFSDFFKQMQMRFPATTSHFFASGSRARAARSRFPCLLCHVSRCLSLGNSQILLLSPFQGNLNAESRRILKLFCPQVRAIGWWSASLLSCSFGVSFYSLEHPVSESEIGSCLYCCNALHSFHITSLVSWFFFLQIEHLCLYEGIAHCAG